MAKATKGKDYDKALVTISRELPDLSVDEVVKAGRELLLGTSRYCTLKAKEASGEALSESEDTKLYVLGKRLGKALPGAKVSVDSSNGELELVFEESSNAFVFRVWSPKEATPVA